MRKRGKFEAPSPKKTKSPMLQSYLVSLMCLVMCAVMFLGTTMAWFTSDVTSSGNEIHIGILKAQLLHKNDDGAYTEITNGSDYQIFDKELNWQPDMETIEELMIVNDGDLAFNYSLQFLVSGTAVAASDEESVLTAEEVQAIAQCFEVSYLDTPEVVNGEEIWTKVTNSKGEVATLAEILEERIPIFEGEMAPEKGTAKVYKVKLYFKQLSEFTDLMGKTLRIDVRLIASQKAQEYPGYEDVELTQTDLTGYVFKPYTVYHLSGEYTTTEGLLIDADNVVLQGDGTAVIDTGTSSVYDQAGLFVGGDNVTVRNLTVKTTGEEIDAIKVSTGSDPTGMVKNVTLRELTVSSESGSGINLHSVDGAVVDRVNFQQYGEVGLSLAEAVNVTVTNSTFAKPEVCWAAIGCMYDGKEEKQDYYETPCSFTVDDSNTFENPTIYSERPADAPNGKDELKLCPTGWVFVEPEEGPVWVCMPASAVPTQE